MESLLPAHFFKSPYQERLPEACALCNGQMPDQVQQDGNSYDPNERNNKPKDVTAVPYAMSVADYMHD